MGTGGGGIVVEAYVSGLQEVFAKLEQKELQAREAMITAMMQFALLIERIAKNQYVPVVTGRLKASIGGQFAPPPFYPGDALFENVVTGDVVQIWMGTNVIYAAWVEAHKPYLGPALMDAQAGAQPVLEAEFALLFV